MQYVLEDKTLWQRLFVLERISKPEAALKRVR
jgi:hypothetical protein